MTPEELIATLDPSKQQDAKDIHALVRATLPELEVRVKDGMVGYGPYRYRYESGREGDSFRVCWRSGATGLSLYVSAMDGAGWIVEQAAARLGKVSAGKSCIRMKRLADADRLALKDVLRRVSDTKAPGEIAPPEGPASVKKNASAKKNASPKKKKG